MGVFRNLMMASMKFGKWCFNPLQGCCVITTSDKGSFDTTDDSNNSYVSKAGTIKNYTLTSSGTSKIDKMYVFNKGNAKNVNIGYASASLYVSSGGTVNSVNMMYPATIVVAEGGYIYDIQDRGGGGLLNIYGGSAEKIKMFRFHWICICIYILHE